MRRGSPLENFIASNPKLAEKLFKNRHPAPGSKIAPKRAVDVARPPVRTPLVNAVPKATKVKLVAPSKAKAAPETKTVDLEGASLAKRAFATQSGIVPQPKSETPKPKPQPVVNRVSLVRERARASRLAAKTDDSKSKLVVEPSQVPPVPAKAEEEAKEEAAENLVKAEEEAKEEDLVKAEEEAKEEDLVKAEEVKEEDLVKAEEVKEEDHVKVEEEEEAVKKEEEAVPAKATHEAKPPSTPVLPTMVGPEVPRVISRRERLTRALANKPVGMTVRALGEGGPRRKECGCRRRR